MAEEDVALAAIRIKADGIEVLDIVDSKYKNLGSTMAKGKARAEGNAEAMEKLRKISEKSAKSTQNNSVKNIESLMIMEAATSATNQLISARYKEIDSKLASGEITDEEAEKLRKEVKQQEKYSSALEKTIAMLRFYKVAQYAAAAAQTVFTKATQGGTAAIKLQTAAMLKNPFIRFAVLVLGLTYTIAKLNREFGFLSDQLQALDRKLDPVTRKFEAILDSIESITGFDIQNNKIFEAFLVE
ncbi:MAG TPA: hypothetical protein DCM40_29540 [Maribacter sp.]|nr:hypothetical protein [Maribacter sp.]|tara:strand:- start:376 stop:1104 length:729 start_codon:yes stop_codon:yes gene_type:complete